MRTKYGRLRHDQVSNIRINIESSGPENAKVLAYRLFQIAERKGWAGEAYVSNSLVIRWPYVQSKAAELQAAVNSAERK